LTHAAFNVVSIVTTTGFASDDYMQWGSFAVLMFLFLTAVGGCTGSTTGGPKIFRYQVLAMLLRRHRNETVMPHAVNVRRYGGRPVGDDVVRAVLVLFALYGATVICLALGLAATGLDIETSFSGALTAVSNVGPGIGEKIGPVGSFAQLSDQALWMLSFGMLVGRLEFTTVFILFSRRFWRT
jgi:trk system potassium uptake protein TrkH